MTCRELVEFLMAYLDRELAQDQHDRFERHLAVCEECVVYMKAYVDSEQAVASFGAVAGSPSSTKSSAPGAGGVSQADGPQRSEVVLSDEDLIREIARQHPEFGLMRIQRELRRPERGSRDLNPVQIYVLLRKLDLDTKERREAFARSAQPTSR